LDALRFATVLRESGTDGNGGALEDIVVEVGVVVLFDPVRPTEALVAPLLVSHGFGGDGADILSNVRRPRLCAQKRRLLRRDDGGCRQCAGRQTSRGWQFAAIEGCEFLRGSCAGRGLESRKGRIRLDF
jgi:hypothetical protein